MDDPELAAVLEVVRAFESLGWLTASDWADIGVAFLVSGVEDPDITELACLDAAATGWETDRPSANLYDRYAVGEPSSTDAVDTVARALATDLRARPANVSGPMIRLLAKLGPPNFESELATRAFGAEEYLDCSCVATVDPSFEAELEGLPSVSVRDDLLVIVTRRLRSTLPQSQPPHNH